MSVHQRNHPSSAVERLRVMGKQSVAHFEETPGIIMIYLEQGIVGDAGSYLGLRVHPER
jgi:hypothetical protein